MYEERRKFVEAALGYRIRKVGDFRYSCEILHESGHGRVTAVCPASQREFEMFQMLCRSDADWAALS